MIMMNVFIFRHDDTDLPYIDTGGDKPVLHFSHANGIPPGVYMPLVEKLAEHFRVVALGHRGQMGGGGYISDWHQLAGDLAAFIEFIGVRPIFGVGHSIGGVVSMFCAAQRPELFSRIMMLDPVMLSRRLITFVRIMCVLGMKKNHPLARKARARRAHWADRADAVEYFRPKGMFHGWREEFFQAYVDHALCPTSGGNGLTLLCPPEAEARGFENYSPDVWAWPGKVTVPVRIVRGEKSDVLTPSAQTLFCALCASAEPITVPGANHFIPMQKPVETLDCILKFGEAL
jgi:pimeloyl-ACP methyl ester carboxylesterase